MKNPFNPIGQSSSSMDTTMSTSATFPTSDKESKGKNDNKESLSSEKKESWWKKMFSPKSLSKTEAEEKTGKTPLSQTFARSSEAPSSRKLDELQSRHQELMTRMKDLCDRIESDKDRPVQAVSNTLPPIPRETIDALNSTQQEVNGALHRMNGHLEESRAGQGRMIESMDHVDQTLGAIRSSTDRSVQTMEQIRAAADSMGLQVTKVGSHIDQSQGKFEKLFFQMQEAERGFVEEFAKLQKRSTMITISLASAIFLSIIALAVVVLSAS